MPNQKPRSVAPGVSAFLKTYSENKDLIAYLPRQMAYWFKEIPEALRNIPEDEMRVALKTFKNNPDWEPSVTQEALRSSFWVEYDNAIRNNRAINEKHIFQGIVTETTFIAAMKKTETLAWITTPPLNYMLNIEALLAMGLRRVRDILSMPVKDDPKVAEILLKTVMMLDMRMKGGYTQRSEQKIQTQHVPAVLEPKESDVDLKAIEDRIKELETKTTQTKTLPAPDSLVGLVEARAVEVLEASPGKET